MLGVNHVYNRLLLGAIVAVDGHYLPEGYVVPVSQHVYTGQSFVYSTERVQLSFYFILTFLDEWENSSLAFLCEVKHVVSFQGAWLAFGA